jgi:hypothetical protein
MLGLSPWLSLVAVLLAVLLSRIVVSRRGGSPDAPTAVGRIADVVLRALGSAQAPWVAGAITGAATWYVWGSLTRSAVVHDEAAYLLQAELFARLRWTAPAPALPQFFEQLYVNLSPAIASKYPPGTSLLLAPGVMLGLPGLPVVLMNALTGGLVYAIGRRLGGGVTATLAWAFWLTSFPVLYFHAMYLSEVPSSLAWLGVWWGLLRWRESDRPRDLAIAAGALGLCAITRPLTAVALGIVCALVVIATVAQRDDRSLARFRRGLAPFAVGGAAAALVLGLWSWRSTGDPRVSPLGLYTRTYVPFDRLGFGVRSGEEPSARLPADQLATSRSFHEEHRRHRLSETPRVALMRLRMIAHDMWYDWRGGLALLALVGLLAAPPGLWLGVGALGLHVLLYLLYAHPWTWSLYYTEGLPVLAIVTATGIRWLHARATGRVAPERPFAVAGFILLLAAAYPAARTASLVRAQIASDHEYYDSFARLLPTSAGGAIVFVRYAPAHNDGLSLVRNVPDRDRAPVWTAYDRGAENSRLAASAPQRALYLFDEASWTLRPMPRVGESATAPR